MALYKYISKSQFVAFVFTIVTVFFRGGSLGWSYPAVNLVIFDDTAPSPFPRAMCCMYKNAIAKTKVKTKILAKIVVLFALVVTFIRL